MVMARLHIICGNCGCNDMFEGSLDLLGTDREGVLSPAVYLSCRNCCTLHNIEDNLTKDLEVRNEDRF